MAVSQPVRAVLDTNVLVSALLYRDGGLSWLEAAWQEGGVTPLASVAVVRELTRILLQLGQKKFNLDPAAVESTLVGYLNFTESVTDNAQIDRWLPRCKDPDDQKFIELAYRGGAHALVTSDNALLGLAHKTPFSIVSPVRFRRLVNRDSDRG